MVSNAIEWINAAATIWKLVAGGIVALTITSAGVGIAYAVIKAESRASQVQYNALEGRVDNIETHKDTTYLEWVKAEEKLRIARETVRAAETAATNEYRKEMRDRMRVQENDTSSMKATLEQIDKRIP